MSHYMPGSGFKKPLNMLETPVYPDIKKAPPRFVWSRKHWMANPGAVLRDTEHHTQFVENAVLAQSRDYNKTVYGSSSHRDVVNAEFRPPLISHYEDIAPLSRLPTKIHAIVPHINPSTAGHDGTSSYAAKNERVSGIEGALTDRVQGGQMRPTFYAPLDLPQDNSVLPDLELKMPSVSVNAGFNIPITIDGKLRDVDLGDSHITTPIDAGYTTAVTVNGESGLEHITLLDNRPSASASAGMNTPINIDGEMANHTLNLQSKLSSTPIQVLNPGSEETGFKDRVWFGDNTEKEVRSVRPSYSYAVPADHLSFRMKNEDSHHPHFRTKLQPERSYGQISQTGGYIPRSGIDQPRETFKGKMHEKINPPKKVKGYRF